MTDLIDALRAKYKTPQAALAALGLDSAQVKGPRPKMAAVADALKKEIKARTGIAQDAELGDLLALLDALKQSEQANISTIETAVNEANEAKTEGEIGGGEGGSEEGIEEKIDIPAREETDAYEEDPKPQPKKEKPMAGLTATAPSGSVPALASQEEEKARDVDPGLQNEVAHDDPAQKLHALLSGKLSPEELKQVGEVLLELAGGEDVEGADEAKEEAEDESEEEKKEEAKDEEPQEPVKKEGHREGAMDAATVKSLISQAVAANDARHLGIRKAMAHVKSSAIGELAMDEAWKSGDDVYRAALTMAEVPNIDGIHASALPAILDLIPRAGSVSSTRPASRIAQDASAAKDTLVRFPDSNRLKRA